MEMTFTEIATGTLEGMLFEKQYDTFVNCLEGHEVWYAFDFERDDFTFVEISTNDLKNKLTLLRNEVKGRKKHNTFPFTYFKNNPHTLFIKIYDPLKCGSSCSINTPDPWWIFSRVKPHQDEFYKLFPKKETKKSFFKSLAF